MKAPQNRLAKINSGIESWVERLFSIFGSSPIQPAEILRKLENSMEDGALQERAGHWLAPNVYDINLSVKDHQRLVSSKDILISGWQDSLINFAKRKHYTLKTNRLVIRMHGDSKVRLGLVRIEAKLEDARNMGTDTISNSNISETQQLDPAQLALLRAQLAPGQPLPGIDNAANASPYQGKPSAQNIGNNPPQPPYPVSPRNIIPTPAMPWAQLTIRLPQGGQQVYQIEKPEINIGRQLLNNDIVVEDKRVSRYHAKIIYGTDRQFTIINLSSTNGIVIDGHPINNSRPYILHNGNRFTIGSYEFYFERR